MPKKQLSVIIVAYNALPYLDLTLRSVVQSTAHLNSEIIVVDNDSDEPVSEHVEKKFPEVNLVASRENLGFGKANNLAVSKCNGEVILFLNPDTIISKDVIDKTLNVFENEKKLGAAGLRMINGNGEFLPESKRSVPSLWSSFCRISGLSVLFPKSKVFAAYRLGHLPENSVSEVEVLSGACMFVRVKESELKLFDPAFFMYGEDIDLSYRIGNEGYAVKYLGEQSIVHFKGESTNKKSWSFHYWFYKTMWMFRIKHCRGLVQKLSNAILIPILWTLMILAFLKSRINNTGKNARAEARSLAVIGPVTQKLSSVIRKNYGEMDSADISEADLIIINVAHPQPGEFISLLDNKRKDQKVLFWNEELEVLFGSFDAGSAGVRLT